MSRDESIYLPWGNGGASFITFDSDRQLELIGGKINMLNNDEDSR